MSVGLMLVSLDGSIRHDWPSNGACDRPLLRAMSELPVEERLSEVSGGDVWQGAEPIWRVKSVKQMREALLARFDFNASYWNDLCDLLARDPDTWLYFSI